MSNDSNGMSSREGQIITFYSFKGGTGRTMALANVAWLLAANGKRVLAADWDLESPGLHRFFQPFLERSVGDQPGIIDFIRRYEWDAVESGIKPDQLSVGTEQSMRAREMVAELVGNNVSRLTDYVVPLQWPFPREGRLDFLPCGKQDNTQLKATMGALDWDNFWDTLHGGQYFDALRSYLKANYDYALIDSRTGLSDVADICTIHLPDIIVDCFTLSTQGIEGGAAVANAIRETYEDRERAVLPVPMRIETAEKEKLDSGRSFAMRKFGELPAGMSADERRTYWAEVEVPYEPFYAYEETLAVFGDRPGSPGSLLSSYERITGRITGGAVSALPPMDESRRQGARLKFDRREALTASPSASAGDIVLDFSPRDQIWAEWFGDVLATAGISVRWMDEMPGLTPEPGSGPRVIALVTDSYIAQLQDASPRVRPTLAIALTEGRMPYQLTDVPIEFLGRMPAQQAAARVLERIAGERPVGEVVTAVRYPGDNQAEIVRMPARNSNFTGRAQELAKLRGELRARQATVVLSMSHQGLGGVGKTQLALEYVHRFQADYDIVWWIPCGQSQYIDSSLYELGQEMRSKLQLGIPEEGSTEQVVRQVLALIGSAETGYRSLMIYDNADDISTVKGLLPERHDHGHVLITSRAEEWQNEGHSVQLDVFRTEEGVGHLRFRIPAISDQEAGEVAEFLGNLPLAMAVAGAWLASTGTPVSVYLEELSKPDSQPPEVASTDESDRWPLDMTSSDGSELDANLLSDYPHPVTRVLDLSLDLLEQRSPAAIRLLELCSVMAPDIAQSLIEGERMVSALRQLDPAISESAMVFRLIRLIDNLALIKVDNNEQQIQVHRLVQAAVRKRLAAKNGVEGARQAVHQMLVGARPEGDVDNPRYWPRYQVIWTHLTPSGVKWSEDETVRQLLIDRVRYLRQRDDLERGRRRAIEIEQAWKEMLLREPAPELAESLQRQLFQLRFNLANILRDLAEFEESKAIDQSVLDGQQQLLGAEHPHTLSTRSSLAADLRAMGDYDAALELDRATYRSWLDTTGDEYPRTLAAANNLALSLLVTGEFQAALDLDRDTLEKRTRVLLANHPRTLSSGSALARDLLEAGRYGDAVRQIDSVFRQCQAALGEEDRATLNARVLLGVALRCDGRADEAAEHVGPARTGLTSSFGADSTDALACRLSHALNRMALNDVQGGIDEARAVLAVYDDRLGSDHPHSLICRLDISSALFMQKDYSAARLEAQRAADRLVGKLGADHPYALAAQMVVANVLVSQGQLVEAVELEEYVTAQRDHNLGPRHPDALRSRLNLLLTQQQLGMAGARERRQEAVAELTEMLGVGHPDVATARAGEPLLAAIDPQPF